MAARFVRVLLFIRIVTGKDQLERATRRMVSIYNHMGQSYFKINSDQYND